MNTSPHSPEMYYPYIVQNELGFPMSSYSISTANGIRQTKQLRLPYKLTCFVACINHYYVKMNGLLANKN